MSEDGTEYIDAEIKLLQKLVYQDKISQDALAELDRISSNQSSDNSDEIVQLLTNICSVASPSLATECELLDELEKSLLGIYSRKAKKGQIVDGFRIDAVTKMYNSWMKKDLPLVGEPYPLFCGKKVPEKDTMYPTGLFICFKKANEFILGIIADIMDKDSYQVVDPIPYKRNLLTYKINKNCIIPLPQSLPNKVGSECEFQMNESVLSLWCERGVWTTMFYFGDIAGLPSKQGDSYKVKFYEENGPPVSIPAKFIVKAPSV